MSAEDPLRSRWDVLVVGTGIGGATIGHALARAGKRVLFCEKGPSHLTTSGPLRGRYAESYMDGRVSAAQRSEVLARTGRAREAIEVDEPDGRRWSFVPFIGNGTGGSSALSGMAMERFFPEDFEPRQGHPEASAAAKLPETWPISYAELRPYYAQAERLYGVRGSADPLREDTAAHQPSPPMSAANQRLFDLLQARGLHPYRLPTAYDRVAGCGGCQGHLCRRSCKNDSARSCLQPALQQHGAELLDRCEVVDLRAADRRVDGVVCRRGGKQFVLRADTVILAAGALATPALLLASRSPRWPDGLANGSGCVGRYLMRHLIDLYAVRFDKQPRDLGDVKEVALNDFYGRAAGKYGTVQSFGRLPSGRVLTRQLQQGLHGKAGRALAAGLARFEPLAGAALEALFGPATVLASTLEDLPYHENRVSLQGTNGARRLRLRYSLASYERRRIEDFRRRMRRLLSPHRHVLLKQAENVERIAHVCGTCRFGEDPSDSVLDSHNRAHELDNLYVVDSSFFPSSGGTNPSLTIAANALRVADHLTGNHLIGGAE